MKLLGCHIENFGTFHNCDLTFNEGLNVIMQQNGWGKTTLAAFIKAMLYGFDGKRVRNVAANERLRYKPWQGGKYGGTLDFEASGREYRIVRFFGTTGSRDTVKVLYLATGRSALGETGSNVGEWLFGLDANAFQKSVYMVQNGLGNAAANASLRNRLNALVNEADDVAGYEKAQATLETRRKFYKKTGDRGTIAEVSKDITRLVGLDAAADDRILDLRRVEDEIDSYASALAVLDEQIAAAKKEAEDNRAVVQRAETLRKFAEQLQADLRAAQDAYQKALDDAGGAVPDARALNEAQRLVAELARLGDEATRAHATADASAAQQKTLASKYADNIPRMNELQDMRARLANLRTMELAQRVPSADESEERGRIRALMLANPDLLVRADNAIARADYVLAVVADGKTAAQELQAASTLWTERRREIDNLLSEYEVRTAAVPNGASEEAKELRLAARELRSMSEEAARLMARYDELESSLTREKVKLDSLPGNHMGDASDVDALDSAAEACATAILKANEARSVRDSCAERLRVAEVDAQEMRERLGKGYEEDRPTKRIPPFASIACFVAAAGACLVGIVLGPVLFAVAVALVIVGLVLLKGSAGNSRKHKAEFAHAASEIEMAIEAAREELVVAERHLTESEKAARETNATLMDVVSRLFPGEGFDSATIIAQVPVLKNRLYAWPEQAQKVEKIQDQLASVREELVEVENRADVITTRFVCAKGDTYLETAAAMDTRASELERLIGAAEESNGRLIAAVARQTGRQVEELDEVMVESYLAMLKHADPPEAEGLLHRECLAQDISKEYATELSALLESFGSDGVGVGELGVGVERLSQVVDSYRDALRRQEATDEQSSAPAVDLVTERKSIGAWAQTVGADGAEALTDAWFDAASADIVAFEQAKRDESKARNMVRAAKRTKDERYVQLDSFLAEYGMTDVSDPEDALSLLTERTGRIADLKKSVQLAEAELNRWLAENEDSMVASEKVMPGKSGGVTTDDRLQMLESQREILVSDKVRCEEQRNAILKSLENRLAVHQEIALLSKKKQRALSNLFTIQKTSEYLRSAREGLDERYLGDLAKRFDEYANAWLDGAGVDAVVSPDFDVRLYEGNTAHEAAAYSTGYVDLLDMCFRMALVDALFQAEQPFLIMDDPFASMDAEKIGGAFLLLQALANRYQIVYFTCHPARTMEQAMSGEQTVFTLPEQHASRELPSARVKREAAERAKAQAKLVASYAVVPVTSGRASIAPDGRRSINSNLLSVGFVVDDSMGSDDNSFEVHFIDGKGRVLCDRQTVEVIGGRVVPDSVRFSLSTRDDSGATYDMVIHENGREPFELAARIPYRAEVAFATGDFDF